MTEILFDIPLAFACLPCTSTVQGLPVGRNFGIWTLNLFFKFFFF
jgi:hypothetical protein